MAATLEEALLSIRLVWDLSTPAEEIVEKVREQDLSLIQSLEMKCKDQLLAIAFKLARDLKIPAVVALLLNGRSTILNSVLKKADSAINVPIKTSEGGAVSIVYKQGEPFTNPLARKVETPVVNPFGKKVDGFDDTFGGTLVDLVLRMALAHSNSCILNKPGAKCKSYVKVESVDLWQAEGSSLYKNRSDDFDDINFKRLEDWATSDSDCLKDFSKWDESFSGLKSRQDSGEWEEVTSKSRKKSHPAPVLLAKDPVDSRPKKPLSDGAEVERSAISKFSDYVILPAVDDGELNCEIARKLLECLLFFSPRLSGHSQSPYLPPLIQASQASDGTLVSLLLDAGAPVNEKDADGNTALHWALRQATPLNRRTVNSQVVNGLLKAGANVMTGNKLGATPVHTAAGHGHFEALLDILEKDSSGVNVMAATKETPLHYAVKNNHIACAFLLLKHGANRNVASLRNQKPIQLAPSMEMRALLLHDDKVIKENTWESFKSILVNKAFPSSPLYSLAMQTQTQFPSIADASGIHQSTQDGNSFEWLSAQTLAINSRDLCQSEMDVFSGKESVNLPQYKTVMCHFLASTEGCGWGPRCHFAHSEEELIGADRIDGLDLRAGGSQSDDGSDQSVKNFKTKLCTHHENTGKCPHGAKCTFAHGTVELRGTLSSAAICIQPPVRIDTRPSSANSLGSSTSSEKGDDYMGARKVFVGGLPHFIQSDDLWDFFEGEFGKVVDAVVICGVDVDGKARSRGFGFVVFHDPRHADVAVKRHYLPFRGKKVEVKRAMARMDYGEESIKLNSPTCSFGVSSSISPISISRSSTFGSSSPIISRSKEMPHISLIVPQQAWSLPPLAVESLRKPSQEITQPSPSNSISFSERIGFLGSELVSHLVSQQSAPSLSHLSLNDSGNTSLQKSLSEFHHFCPSYLKSSSFSLDSGLQRSSSLLDSGAFSPLHGSTSSSNFSSKPHHCVMSGSSIPYSNGTSFQSIAKYDIDHPSQSFFSSIPGSLSYSHGSDPLAPADDEEEFSELLAILQGERVQA